jgi:hypothetical protein
MTQDQALSVLVQAARVAQAKGAFTLEDAKVVAEAVAVFVPAQNPESEVKSEVTAEQEVTESGN